jgi:pyruvate dehydrogenase E1 component alpha subunit
MADLSIELTKEQLLDYYQTMVLIRRFEERSLELYQDKKNKKIGGVYLHLYNGQEAVGVGSIKALRPDDHVITAYRDHGPALARGLDPRRLMAEMFGRTTGVSGGKGGSMHMADRTKNFWGGYAIVGGHLPLAAGIALEVKYNNKDQVVLCFIGDGATNNGYFHEAVNLSAVWKLPVVWMIENNLYGMGTPIYAASGQTELVKRAVAYGIKEGPRIDGQDVLEVHKASVEAIEYARANGPILVEAMTYRYEGHGVSDKIFRTRTDEMAKFRDRDPIVVLREHLVHTFGHSITREIDELDAKAVEVVEDAIDYADKSPIPTYNDLINHIYA